MMARMMPAAKIPMPTGGPRQKPPDKARRQTTIAGVPARIRPGYGPNTIRPHMPYTMEGTAASSSTAVPKGRLSQGGDSSVKNRAIPKLTGTAISQGNHGSGQGAVNHDQATVLILHRVPDTAGEKRQPGSADGRPGTDHQGHHNGQQQAQRKQCCSTGHAYQTNDQPCGPDTNGRGVAAQEAAASWCAAGGDELDAVGMERVTHSQTKAAAHAHSAPGTSCQLILRLTCRQ